MKKTRDTTALVKDLEKQIDYLVGYSPSGGHWKTEWYQRNRFIDDTLSADETPPEIREKINRIQDSLWRLREGKKQNLSHVSDQPYLEYKEERFIPIKEGDSIVDYIVL